MMKEWAYDDALGIPRDLRILRVRMQKKFALNLELSPEK